MEEYQGRLVDCGGMDMIRDLPVSKRSICRVYKIETWSPSLSIGQISPITWHLARSSRAILFSADGVQSQSIASGMDSQGCCV
jgi:hypothetical protein